MTKKTIFKKLSIILMALLFCGIFTIGSSIASDKKVYRWKLQSGYPHGDLSFELLKGFATDVKKFSNGKLVISVFADAEIVPLEQLFESTQKGVLDIL
ncbi:MAG: hypothetical protein PF503_23470, partial [Desulfobacula sp.]|nr:hypothetical protein [Desulfobacula sp.]